MENEQMLLQVLSSIQEEIKAIRLDISELRTELHEQKMIALNKANREEVAKKLDREEFIAYTKHHTKVCYAIIIFMILVSIETGSLINVAKVLIDKF